MAYADKAAMEARFTSRELVELTNPDDRQAVVIDEGKLSTALEDASAEIDAVLSTRYALPMENPPSVLTALCCDIARYRLYVGRASEEVETRYKNATELLKRIAKGDVSLGTSGPATSGSPSFVRPQSVFGEGLFQ